MSLHLDALRAFVKVAELGSFTRAAEQLSCPKARVSEQVRRLERDVGGALFTRTTRVVRLTADGEAVLARARRLVAEADELEALFAAPSALRGRVRVDLPVNLACDVVIPRLPELHAEVSQLRAGDLEPSRRLRLEGEAARLRGGRSPRRAPRA